MQVSSPPWGHKNVSVLRQMSDLPDGWFMSLKQRKRIISQQKHVKQLSYNCTLIFVSTSWLSPPLGYLFGHRGEAFGGVLGPQVKDVEFSLQWCGNKLVHVDVFPVKLYTAYLHTVWERFPVARGSSVWVCLTGNFPLKGLSFGFCGTRRSPWPKCQEENLLKRFTYITNITCQRSNHGRHFFLIFTVVLIHPFNLRHFWC